LDLTSQTRKSAQNDLIVKVLVHLDEIDLIWKIPTVMFAMLYLIGQFASGAGKKAGEFYTPQQVVVPQIVTAGKDQLKIRSHLWFWLFVVACKASQERQCFYGQEMNPTTYNLCRMNDYARCALQAFRYQERRHLRATATDMRFEAIVANPPFRLIGLPVLVYDDDRFSLWKLLPRVILPLCNTWYTIGR
jgi:type I restriction enzyme M protein